MRQKTLKGDVDYDYRYDILFFKARERDYRKSIELENLVIDIDNEGLIVGIQIREASKFLKLKKKSLLSISHWNFEAIIHNRMLELRLLFKVEIRNKIVEKNPIIMQQISEPLPDSQLTCTI